MVSGKSGTDKMTL